ncbi:MAG TPA: hypothetical protein VGM87_17050 [Roseomonas sp.]|jgi:hypothetical protein
MRKLFLASLGLLGLAAVSGVSTPAAAASVVAPAIEHAALVQDRVTVAQDQADARRHRRHRRHVRRIVRH